MKRRDNESHPRCTHCGAWCLWDGVNEQCNNPRCNTGFTHVKPRGVNPNQLSLMEEPAMTKYIHCTICNIEWLVSQVDPDSTMEDAISHAMRRHPDEKALQIIVEGKAK